MILVDTRSGSKELIKPLRDAGLDVEGAVLEFGDVVFEGKGAHGSSVDVAIEFKKLGELISSIRDGRFAGHQLPGLVDHGRFDYAWLLVEGYWKHDDKGFLSTYQGKQRGWVPVRGRMTAAEFEKHLLTYEVCSGIRLRFSNSRRDTIRILVNLYRWWTDTALDHHTSHIQIHEPASLIPISDFRRAVCMWPGVGLKVSAAAEERFLNKEGMPSVAYAASADQDEWAEIVTSDDKGNLRRFGHTAAEKLVQFLRGREV